MGSRNKNEGSVARVKKLEDTTDKVGEKQGTRFCRVFVKLGRKSLVFCAEKS